ncbi:MAG TPA: ATP-binding protein [Bryobacteraceae bacterium]|nr:ATP-binding protein [Bryobacteraceae bacterium]
MRLHYRSAVFKRLFWGAFLPVLIVATAAMAEPLRSWVWLVLAGLASAFTLALLLSRGVDKRIARMREFTEALLETENEPPGGPSLDQLGALDHSLIRMARQTGALVERGKAEAARQDAILASMVEGVLAVDEGLRITFCNRALARLAGGRMPPGGTPLMEFVRDTALQETLTEVIRTGQPAKRRLQIPAASTGRSFELQAAPLGTPPKSSAKPGERTGAIAILHDITDLERLEQVRNDFVANVSHEFRTPLAAISGYAETLLDGGLEDEAHNRRFLEIISSNATRLSNIAADLLTLSELQTSAGPKETELVSISEAIDNALATIAAEAALRGVSLERGPLHDLTVRGSRYRLEQALVNLLANAVKFNRSGGSVRAETLPGAAQVSILISDTGVGIPSSDLPRIFERFYRVDKARSREVGGTGLGLSIVKHIVERMHGSVSASSELGKGSVFKITLPLA